MTQHHGLQTLIVAATILSGGPALAQLSMSVAPVRVEHAIAPGDTWTDVVTVDNVSDEPLRARISVADWYLERDGTPVFVKRGQHPELSMSRWVEVNPTELTIPPGGQHVVRYTVTVPPHVPAASYRTALLIESLPDFTAIRDANVAYLTARIGVVLYNQIGPAQPELRVVGQELVADAGERQSRAVKLTLRNIGVSTARVRGESQLLHPSRNRLDVVSIPEAVVLPQSEREIVLRLRDPIPPGDLTILSRLDTGQPTLLEVETRVGGVVANDQ